MTQQTPLGEWGEPPRSTLRAWGIDLGTTNSTVAEAVWEAGKPQPECRCLEIEQPTTDGIFTSPLVPSVVAIRPEGGHWVGEGARRLRARPQEAALVLERTLFYNTKNDMGLAKTYYRAPDGYDHASKIAGHVLRFLRDGALEATAAEASSVTVTVPASFLFNQRSDTVEAGRMAGLPMGDHDLLDEPIAALLDYLLTRRTASESKLGPQTVVVFDFGGGTCDVCVAEVRAAHEKSPLQVAYRSVSRYCRLGGSDLDVAIVQNVLIPDLCEENGLRLTDLTWGERRKVLEPQLIGTAEGLKMGLCVDVDRLIKFGKYDPANAEAVVARQPGVECLLGKRRLRLSRPSLSAAAWDEILEPFLDTEHVYQRDREYGLTQSVFAPILDALDRARVAPEDVDACLLVGGSSLIPQVREAVDAFFENADLWTFDDDLQTQMAVARGAAWHALHLAKTGRPLVQPVTDDGLSVMTREGAVLCLIPLGSAIPFPEDGGWVRLQGSLAVPRGHRGALELQLVSERTRQQVFRKTWRLPPGTRAGARITIEARLLATQQLECVATLEAHPEVRLEAHTHNPLINVIAPNRARQTIERLEQELRERNGGSAEERDRFVELAKAYAELNHNEHALDILRSLLRLLGRPDPEVLLLMGMYYGRIGDFAREEKAYVECDQLGLGWDAPMFNLALSRHQRGLHEEALDAITKALDHDAVSGPSHTLRAQILRALGRQEEASEAFREALALYPSVQGCNRWELGWLHRCAAECGDEQLAEAALARLRARSTERTSDATEGAMLPDLARDGEGEANR